MWFPILLKIKNPTGSSKCAAGSVKYLIGASNYVLQYTGYSCTFWGTKICSWINKYCLSRGYIYIYEKKKTHMQLYNWIREMLNVSHKKGQTFHKHCKYYGVSRATKYMKAYMKAKLTTPAKQSFITLCQAKNHLTGI